MKTMKKTVCALIAMALVLGVCTAPVKAEGEDSGYYAHNLQADINAAEDGDIVTMRGDIYSDTGKPIVVRDKHITLDMASYSITSGEPFPVIKVMPGAILEITNSELLSGDSTISNGTLATLENWREMYGDDEFGLIDVQEGGEIRLVGGYYVGISDIFTKTTAGEIFIGGSAFDKKPNGEYEMVDDYYMKHTKINGSMWWTPNFGVELEYTKDAEYNVATNQEITFHAKITNYASDTIKNLYYGLAYSLDVDSFDKANDVEFAQLVAGDGYVQEGKRAFVDSIDPGETIDIVFKGKVPEEVAGKEIVFLLRMVNVFDEDPTIELNSSCHILYGAVYNVVVDTQDSIPKDDASKPVEEVTVVQDKDMEETLKNEMTQTIEAILNQSAGMENVSGVTAMKVISAVQSGQAVKAELVVKEMTEEEVKQIATNDKAAIEDKVISELGKDADVQYLDLSIVLKAGERELGTLNKLEEEITITVAIPEELKAEGRIYKVIRNHNGVIEVLDTIVNEDGTISFKTDRFSTYALAYADKVETSTNIDAKPTTGTKAPQTGDNSSAMGYVVMCLVALVAIISVNRKREFEAK